MEVQVVLRHIFHDLLFHEEKHFLHRVVQYSISV